MSDERDKSPGRPTVPQVLEMLRRYRRIDANRLTGGVVHIIVDDGNVAQHHADWCLAQAEGSPEWDRPEDLEIASALAAMTTTQRSKVYATDTYPPVGEWPAPDVEVVYYRYGQCFVEGFDSVEEALGFIEGSEDHGQIASVGIYLDGEPHIWGGYVDRNRPTPDQAQKMLDAYGETRRAP